MLRMIYQGVQFSRFLLCQIDANGSIHERERHKNQLLFENKGCKQLLKLAIHFHSKSHREISWLQVLQQLELNINYRWRRGTFALLCLAIAQFHKPTLHLQDEELGILYNRHRYFYLKNK